MNDLKLPYSNVHSGPLRHPLHHSHKQLSTNTTIHFLSITSPKSSPRIPLARFSCIYTPLLIHCYPLCHPCLSPQLSIDNVDVRKHLIPYSIVLGLIVREKGSLVSVRWLQARCCTVKLVHLYLGFYSV